MITMTYHSVLAFLLRPNIRGGIIVTCFKSFFFKIRHL